MDVKDDPELYKIRHSLAHVLAQAVQAEFPGVKLGFGPPINNGFYYDFDFGDKVIQATDLKKIEKRMKKIIGQRQPFERSEADAAGAVKALEGVTEPYKVENVANLKERGETSFSFYKNGPFIDLCEGPHVEHTGELSADCFKLDRIAGAYWLGDESRKMLTRIYALCFANRDALQDYLKRREMAEKFDHKKLGKELEIFHIDEMVGKGLPLWLPNGAALRDAIEDFAREKEFAYGYKRVATPHITKEALYHTSQHLPAYEESMFPPIVEKDEETGKEERYYLKPMNCPHHHLIFGTKTRSYRDLPLRLSEYGTVYRHEQSGELSGLIRVRGMTMNDAHLYMRLDQVQDEFKKTMQMYMEFYDAFKLKDYTFRLSVRGDENRDKFKGDDKVWDEAEDILEKVMVELDLPFYRGEGEAAFYGPKIDIQFKNLMGREETVSTIQLDFLAAKNFKLKYIDENGEEAEPVIIHRAPLSTHERFVSFIMEYYGGAFPTWCAPVQVNLIPVNSECLDYVQELASKLHQHGMRVEIDTSDNSFNKKIRTGTVRKIPILLIIGMKEVENRQVTVRRYGIKEQETIDVTKFEESLVDEVRTRKNFREPMGSFV